MFVEVKEFTDILLTFVEVRAPQTSGGPSQTCSGIPPVTAGFLTVVSMRRDKRHRGVCL